MKVYFICMGNYYRSRLAEELLCYYAEVHKLSIHIDSGGLDKIPNPDNPGNIGAGVIKYLETFNISPKCAHRPPKNCNSYDLNSSNYIICVQESEQRAMFEFLFPDFKNKVTYWEVPDTEKDPQLKGPDLLHENVKNLLNHIKHQHTNKNSI